MSPEELAQTHSQIIDAKLAELKKLFASVNEDPDIVRILNRIELDDNGKVISSPSNRRIINAAVGLVRKKTRSLRPIVFQQYLEAAEQIERLSTDYITWLKDKQ